MNSILLVACTLLAVPFENEVLSQYTLYDSAPVTASQRTMFFAKSASTLIVGAPTSGSLQSGQLMFKTACAMLEILDLPPVATARTWKYYVVSTSGFTSV